MQNHELIISGAGFCGLMAAQAAASRGVDCLVVENKTRAGSKIHTTGILVKEAADLLDLPRDLYRKIHRVRLYSPSMQSMDLYSPGYYFLATHTEKLLAWMTYNAMQVGAQFKFGDPLIHVDHQSKQVKLRSQNLAYEYLLGCDGAKSKVARCANLGLNKKFLYGCEFIYQGIQGLDEDMMHVFIDVELAKGYIAWILPGVNYCQVGLASRSDKPPIHQLIKKLSKLFDFSQAQFVEKRAGLIPCGGVVTPFAKQDIMLIGDAAGMVSPLTAGGIQPALQMGRLAGIAVSDYLHDGASLPQRSIEGQLLKFTYKKLLRNGADALPINNKMIDAFFNRAFFRRAAQLIFFHNRGLLSLEAWKGILGKNSLPQN